MTLLCAIKSNEWFNKFVIYVLTVPIKLTSAENAS
jgi:hypothetical protein